MKHVYIIFLFIGTIILNFIYSKPIYGYLVYNQPHSNKVYYSNLVCYRKDAIDNQFSFSRMAKEEFSLYLENVYQLKNVDPIEIDLIYTESSSNSSPFLSSKLEGKMKENRGKKIKQNDKVGIQNNLTRFNYFSSNE